MIVKILFKESKPAMYFGNTPHNQWHKHFREYVAKHHLVMPNTAFDVLVSEFPSLPNYKWFNDKIIAAEFIRWGFPIKKIFEESFYEQKLVTEKVNSILIKEKLKVGAR